MHTCVSERVGIYIVFFSVNVEYILNWIQTNNERIYFMFYKYGDSFF